MSTTASALSFPEAEAERGSHLGRGVRIQGKIFSDQDLHVDGEVEGTLEISGHNLTVGAAPNLHKSGSHQVTPVPVARTPVIIVS